ncbi:MAG: site-specific integrase [Bacteroidales bacterium]|nr:site-specific integrase [Bacteroidales bacterium]
MKTKIKVVEKFIEEQIKQLREEHRFGTANNYEKTMRSLESFVRNKKLTFTNFNEQLIADYNTYLISKGLMRNSISFYMRNLRAIYNKAVKQKIVKKKELFSEVYTGIDKTRKRAVDERLISKLYNLKLDNNDVLSLTRDIFIFSYCMRGMSFVDIAYLKKTDISNGVISYCRRKTGQLMNVRIESCMQRIINKYKENASEYIFPIIKSDDKGEAYKQYRSGINIYNRNLGILSDMIGSGCKLSSYTARHSWATAARKHDVPISVISAGMGHSSETTTQIYLKSIEDDVVDRANAEIINKLRINVE